MAVCNRDPFSSWSLSLDSFTQKTDTAHGEHPEGILILYDDYVDAALKVAIFSLYVSLIVSLFLAVYGECPLLKLLHPKNMKI